MPNNRIVDNGMLASRPIPVLRNIEYANGEDGRVRYLRYRCRVAPIMELDKAPVSHLAHGLDGRGYSRHVFGLLDGELGGSLCDNYVEVEDSDVRARDDEL
jgi:hypothetical protein